VVCFQQLPICDLAYSQLLQLFFVTCLHAAAKFFSCYIGFITSGQKNRKAAKVMHLEFTNFAQDCQS
jgi:hypothetical protein